MPSSVRIPPSRKHSRLARIGRWISLALAAGFVGVYLFTGWEHWRLERALDRLRRAGEPVVRADFARPPSNDPNNPVPRWRAAGDAVDSTGVILPSEQFDDWPPKLPLTSEDAARLNRVVRENATPLSLAAAASRLHGRAEWNIPVSDSRDLLSDGLAKQQGALSEILDAAALDAHLRGNDAEAVDRVEELLAQQRAVYSLPTLVDHLAADGIGERTCRTLDRILPTLRIGPGGVDPSRVHALIFDLLDERAVRRSETPALEYDRTSLIETVTTVVPKWNPVRGLLDRDGCLILDRIGRMIRGVREPDWPSCAASIGTFPEPSRLNLFVFVVTSDRRAVLCDYRLFTEDRLAAAALACRWYAAEHGGHYPTDWNDLVPGHLPRIPADPMAAGRPLQYRRLPQPILYSVGEDGIDDGGSEQALNPPPPGNDDAWRCRDVVVHPDGSND